MARYNGRHGTVYMGASGGATAVAVARLNNWTLDMSRPMADATAFGDTNQQYSAGIPNCQGTLSGIWDDTDDALYDAMMQTAGALAMYLYPSSLVPTKYFYGTAHVDMSLAVGVAETIGFEGNFAAASDWGQQ